MLDNAPARSFPIVGYELADCSLCSLLPQRDIHGVCPSKAPKRHDAYNGMMVVGEGPGRTEISKKEPFVGPAGSLLNLLLDNAGIRRDETYISNATMCLPPFSDDKLSFSERHPLATYSCLPRLEAEIAAVRPRVILALGQAALESLTGKDEDVAKRIPFTCPTCGDPPKRSKKCPSCKGYKTNLEISKRFETDHRIGLVAGLVFQTNTLPSRLDQLGVEYIVATYHPSFILRKANSKVQAQVGGQFIASAVLSHMQKARRLLHSPPQWSMKHFITTDWETVKRYTSQATSFFGLDIETDAKEPYEVKEIKCLGIGVPHHDEVMVVDTRMFNTEYFSGDPLFQTVRNFLEDGGKAKVWQNRFYDEQVYYLRHGIVVRGTVGDTMLMHHSLYPDEPHHLGHITAAYTDASPWKPPKSKGGIESFETFEELCLYNARDVRNTCLIVEPIEAEMALENVSSVHDMDMKMTDIALEMQAAGMPVDREKLLAMGAVAQKKADEAYAEITTILTEYPPSAELLAHKDKDKDGKFNLNSAKHMSWALFDRTGPCRLTSIAKTKTGADQMDADTLAKYKHPFVDALLRYREHHKLVSTYVEGEGLRAGPDGRIHPKWNVIGARTGRWSSSPNFQNWPKLIRVAIRAPKGRKLVGADYDQLELRVLAALCGDEEMIRRCMFADPKRKLEPDWDPHSFVAGTAFGKVFFDADPYDKSHDAVLYEDGKCPCGKCRRTALREATKRVVYGLNYGAGAAKILEVILSNGWKGGVLTIEIVERVIRAYFKSFPLIPAYRDEQIRIAAETQEVRSAIVKRRRYFPLGDADATVCYNFKIQSTAADIMNMQLWKLYQSLGTVDPSAVFIAQVHDAIYIECDEYKADAVVSLTENTLTTEMALIEGAPLMKFTAGAKKGDTWAEV